MRIWSDIPPETRAEHYGLALLKIDQSGFSISPLKAPYRMPPVIPPTAATRESISQSGIPPED
jgi:hypothetical protein